MILLNEGLTADERAKVENPWMSTKFPDRQIKKQFLVEYQADQFGEVDLTDLDKMLIANLSNTLGALSDSFEGISLINQQYQVKLLETSVGAGTQVGEDITDNLVALVFRLIRVLRKHKPDTMLEKQAMDYLTRQGYKVNSHQRVLGDGDD